MINLDILLVDSTQPTLSTQTESQLSDSSRARLLQIPNTTRRRQFLIGRLLMAYAANCALSKVHEGAAFPYYAQHANWHATISHSGDYIALVFSKEGRFGLDIEYPQRQRDWLALAERAFADDEIQWISASDSEAQKQRFHQVWTLREAAFKAGLIPAVVGGTSVFNPQTAQAHFPVYSDLVIQDDLYLAIAGAQPCTAHLQKITLTAL